MEPSSQAVSPLRQRMIEDMRMRKLCEKTQTTYIRAVRKFAAYLKRSPDTATVEELRRFQLHLVDQGTSPVTINAPLTGLKFFFDITLGRVELMAKMQPVRVPRTLPVVLSRDEVARLIAAAPNLKSQTALSIAYGTGLRASEVIALKVSDIDSQRMMLRVEQGKGHKDRYAMLSPILLERLLLVASWPCPRQDIARWLAVSWPESNGSGDDASTQPCHPRCRRGRQDRQAGVHAHAQAQLCHPSAGAEGRHQGDPGHARAQETGDHGALHTSGH